MTGVTDVSAGSTLSATRTITDADIDACARLTGDFGAHHMAGLSGKKVAQGLLTLSTAPLLDDADVHVAALNLKFLAPVFSGDTITATLEITERAELPGGGVSIGFTVAVAKPEGVEVLRGTGTAYLGNAPHARPE